MTTSLRPLRLFSLAFVLMLAACTPPASDDAADAIGSGNESGVVGATSAGPSQVQPPGTPQVVEIAVGEQGYEPSEIELKAGVPARLIFTRHVEGACPSQVQIPALGVAATDLPMHEPTAIEFTPDEAGTYTFVCGMDMLEGTLVVTS